MNFTIKLSANDKLFLESLGNVAELWGFNKNIGIIWGLIYLQDRPITAFEIQKILDKSSGSVSMTLQSLRKIGLISIIDNKDDKSIYYEAQLDLWQFIIRVLREREIMRLQKIIESLEIIYQKFNNEPIKKQKLGAMINCLRIIYSILKNFVITGKINSEPLQEIKIK